MRIPSVLFGVRKKVVARVTQSVVKRIASGDDFIDVLESYGIDDTDGVKGIALEEYPHYGSTAYVHIYLCVVAISDSIYKDFKPESLSMGRDDQLYRELLTRPWAVLGFLNQLSGIWVVQNKMELPVLRQLSDFWDVLDKERYFDSNDLPNHLAQSAMLRTYLRRVGCSKEAVDEFEVTRSLPALLASQGLLEPPNSIGDSAMKKPN